MKALWEFFNSLKLTVYLVLAIVAVTIYGSMVIYLNPEVFGDMDQVLFFYWLFGPGLKFIQKTWWFYLLVLMVVVLGINTLVCTVERLPLLFRRYRNPLLNIRDIEMGGGAGRTVELGGAPGEALSGLLGERGYRVFTDGDGLYAEKNRWLPFLPYVVHIGVMVFLAGHLISGLSGYRNSGLYIFEGETAKSPGGDYYLRVNKVKVEQREDGSLKDYGSFLTAIKDGREIKTAWVTANKPMFVEGGAVYQREFGQAFRGLYVQAAVRSTGFQDQIFVEKGAGIVEVPGTPYGFGIDRFIADFALDELGEPYSQSDSLVNPAVHVTLLKEGRPRTGGWMFLREPVRDSFKDEDVSLRLSDMDVRAYSSFDVNRDPSAIIALIASSLVMFGSIVTLYFRRERVWAKIDEPGGRAQVLATDDELYGRLSGDR